MNFARTVRQLRRALTLLQKPVALDGVDGLCRVSPPSVEVTPPPNTRSYQSLQGVYGFKNQEPKDFSCELCNALAVYI